MKKLLLLLLFTPLLAFSEGVNFSAAKDYSGTITAVSTSEEIVPETELKRYVLVFQNLSFSADMYVKWGDDATEGAGSFRIEPGEIRVFFAHFCSRQSFNVICDTSGEAFTCLVGDYVSG